MPYGVVKTRNLSNYHNLNFLYNGKIENGSLIKRGEPINNESAVYQALQMNNLKDEFYLIATPAWSYKNRAVSQNEEKYVNEKKTILRGYSLDANDKFDLTTYSIDNESDVVVGNYVVGQTGSTRPIAVSTKPDGTVYGFIGKIINIYIDGFPYYIGHEADGRMKYAVIEVLQNRVKKSPAPVVIPKPLTGINITTSIPTPFVVDDNITINTSISPVDADLPITYSWSVGGVNPSAIEIIGVTNQSSVNIKGLNTGSATLLVSAINPSNGTGVTDSIVVNVEV